MSRIKYVKVILFYNFKCKFLKIVTWSNLEARIRIQWDMISLVFVFTEKCNQ